MNADERHIKALAEQGRKRLAARMQRLADEQGTDQSHFTIPVNDFLLGLVGPPGRRPSGLLQNLPGGRKL